MRRRIVIADDDPIIISLVTLRLEMADYEVLCARNGEEALALIRKSEPVAAILDHYGLDDVAAVGISLGGWLGIRAAAFEPKRSTSHRTNAPAIV